MKQELAVRVIRISCHYIEQYTVFLYKEMDSISWNCVYFHDFIYFALRRQKRNTKERYQLKHIITSLLSGKGTMTVIHQSCIYSNQIEWHGHHNGVGLHIGLHMAWGLKTMSVKHISIFQLNYSLNVFYFFISCYLIKFIW